jgi:hypothetical protein
MGLWGSALMIGIVALMKEIEGSLFAPSAIWEHIESAIHEQLVLTKYQIRWYLDLRLPILKNCEQ